jgi:hypothetical protein
MSEITARELYDMCRIPYHKIENHLRLKVQFRLCRDLAEMDQIMARELVDEIEQHSARGESTRAILPCAYGPETGSA